MKFNFGLIVLFIGLSAFDILANAGGIIFPFVGNVAETVQESVNELIQIALFSFVALKR